MLGSLRFECSLGEFVLGRPRHHVLHHFVCLARHHCPHVILLRLASIVDSTRVSHVTSKTISLFYHFHHARLDSHHGRIRHGPVRRRWVHRVALSHHWILIARRLLGGHKGIDRIRNARILLTRRQNVGHKLQHAHLFHR